MYYLITPPSHLKVSLRLPASKSISNRALILHALSHGKGLPGNLSDCDDTRVMTEALTGQNPCIDIGAAGTAMRFLTAYFSATPGVRTLFGTPRMQQRPIRALVDALRQMGADIGYGGNEGFPPLHINGRKLHSARIVLPGDISSQYISALLMIGPTLAEGLSLQLTGDIISRPYIDLTLHLMHAFGANADWISPNEINVSPGGYRDTPFTVESDWSAASYWYEMLFLASAKHAPISHRDVELHGLLARSHQGDSRGANLFNRLGIRTVFNEGDSVWIRCHDSPLAHLEEDMTDIPDLTQTFVVTCCLRGITFRFTGLKSLKIKETDRISALVNEMRKLGYVLRTDNASMLCWSGERCPATPSPVISTYDDHRMAMAFAPACLLIDEIRIENPQVVTKSYPGYWDDMRQAGFNIVEKQ